MRDIATIDAERQLVAFSRQARQQGGPLPSIDVADALLDERCELSLGEIAGQRFRGRLAYRQPMTQRLETRLNPHAPIVLSLFRIFFGLLFLCHGTLLLFGWPAGTAAAAGSLFWLSGLIELITGILITLGLFTRPAAFIASGEMAVAFFTQHLPHGFWPISNSGELAVMYCWAFFLLVFTGPGAYALDTGFGPRGPGYVRSYLRRSPRSPRSPRGRRWRR